MRTSSRVLPASAALVCAALACAALATPAAAHHSFTTLYDMGTVTEIEGRITEVRWSNPHIKIYVAASNGQKWEVEAGPVNLLELRMRLEKSLFKIGETVRVRGNPGRTNAQTLWVSNVLLPDKTELLATLGARPYGPWGAKKIVGDPAVLGNRGGRTEPDRGFFATWEPLFPDFPMPRAEPVLTEAGQRAQARYESGKKAIADCEVPGMPFAMMSPYLIQIVKQGDGLLINGEAYDLRRVVHPTAPANPPAPSPLGLSVVRSMTDDEIVVETSRIDYHSYRDIGPAQSDQSHVVEHFTLSADGTLHYEIEITDPVMLRDPWKWGGSFFSKGDEELPPWDCPNDASIITNIAIWGGLGLLGLSVAIYFGFRKKRRVSH